MVHVKGHSKHVSSVVTAASIAVAPLANFSGVRKMVVSKRVVLADVPLPENHNEDTKTE